VYNQPQEFKRIVRSVTEPMENLESVASTAVTNIFLSACYEKSTSLVSLLLVIFYVIKYKISL
jgi:hypothetical protein